MIGAPFAGLCRTPGAAPVPATAGRALTDHKCLIHMTSVLLLRPGSRALLPLQDDLSAAGCQVLATVEDCSKLVQAAVQHAPDLVVGEVTRPDDALFKATQTLAEVLPRPVLLFTSDPDAAHIERATGAGVHAWVVNGYGAARRRPRFPSRHAPCRAPTTRISAMPSPGTAPPWHWSVSSPPSPGAAQTPPRWC